MTLSTFNPMFACFAGHGEAELRMLLGSVAILWVIAGVITLCNAYCLGQFALRWQRPIALNVLLLTGYCIVAGLMFTGRLFDIAPTANLLGILLVPLTAIIHGVFVIREYRKDTRTKPVTSE